MRYSICIKNFKGREVNGFTLVELVVVISVLSTLSAISIPNVLRSIKLNRLDEAKILMDSYAAECLSEFRLGKDLSKVTPSSFSEKKINALGYSKKDGSNCELFALSPSKNDDLLFEFDFRIGIDSGTLIKTASPAEDTSSKNSCELWAGELCTSDQGSKNYWENKFKVEKNKLDCDQKFFDWRKLQPSGSHNIWDDNSDSCSKKIWLHKNYIADSEAKYTEIKTNEECAEARKEFSDFTGEKYISDCQKTYYFHKGVDMGSEDLMQIKLIEENEIKCKVNRESKRISSSNGKYIGEANSGQCGNYYWICNKRILTTLDQWKESDCYTP